MKPYSCILVQIHKSSTNVSPMCNEQDGKLVTTVLRFVISPSNGRGEITLTSRLVEQNYDQIKHIYL
jgi:hypothetical protein